MIKKLKEITIFKDDKIHNALIKINNNGYNGVFVIDKKNNVLGIITDSDIRKNFLKNKLDVNKKVITITQKKFLKIPLSKVENSRKILIRSNKMLLPIVENNKLVDFIHTKELFTEKKIIKKILVVGGLGYIGSILVKDLLQLGYKVNILDINYYGCYFSKETLKNPKLKIFYGDCENKKILDKAMIGCSDVIHLGEIVGDPAVNINQNFSIKNNYENTVLVMSECIKKNINKFIFMSSCSVYGNVSHICTEK